MQSDVFVLRAWVVGADWHDTRHEKRSVNPNRFMVRGRENPSIGSLPKALLDYLGNIKHAWPSEIGSSNYCILKSKIRIMDQSQRLDTDVTIISLGFSE